MTPAPIKTAVVTGASRGTGRAVALRLARGGFAKLAPLERLAAPDDIAGVVPFLIGPDGGWVNAQVLRSNGGYM